MPETQETQTYYATSAFTDPIIILSMIALVLSIPEVRNEIPAAWVGKIGAISAALTAILRFVQAVRPIAMIAPQQVKPVEVKKLEPTQSGTETPAPPISPNAA